MTRRTKKIKLFSTGRSLAGLAIFCVALSFSYVYLLNYSISNTAERKKIEEDATALEVEVAALESDYLAKLGSISLAYAEELGFIDAEGRSSHVSISRSSVSLAPLSNEI